MLHRCQLLRFLAWGKKAPPLPLLTTVPLEYERHVTRWHGDCSEEHCTVVLIHDILSHSKSWSSVVRSLARLPSNDGDGESTGTESSATAAAAPTPLTPIRALQVYAPELRNHGRSGRAPSMSLDECAGDIVEFVKRTVDGPSEVHLVGLGLGGRIALRAAMRAPDLFQHVTAINAAPIVSRIPTDLAAIMDSVAALTNPPASWKVTAERIAKLMPNAFEQETLLLSLEDVRSSFDKNRAPDAKFAIELDAIKSQLPKLYEESPIIEGRQFNYPVRLINASVRPDSDLNIVPSIQKEWKAAFPQITLSSMALPTSGGAQRAVSAQDAPVFVRDVFQPLVKPVEQTS